MPANDKHRVLIVQPALPKYRIPVFRELAERDGIDLTVLHAVDKNLDNVATNDFKTIRTHDYTIRTPLGVLMWNHDHLKYASRKYTDTLIIVGNIRYLSLIPCLIKARLCGIKTVLWTHGYSKNGGNIRNLVRDMIYRLSHKLVFYSKTVCNEFISRGWTHDRVFTAPNSIDVQPALDACEHWMENADELTSFQKENQLHHGQNVIFVSRFSKENRLNLLVEAVAILAKSTHPQIKLILVGKGEKIQQELQALASRLNIEAHLIFTGPIYNELELAKWMCSSQLFCYPANIGLSVQHAIAYNLPVITSDDIASQNPEIEILLNNQTGIFFRHKDVDSLTNALRMMLCDPDLRTKISSAAKHRYDTDYGIENMVDGLVSCIRG